MKVKTYGVHGLTEWHGKVKAGSIEVNVSFTGGTASPSGAQPAYFMTKDPIIQFVIEHSKEYANGFIALVMSQDIDGDHPRMAKPKAMPAPVVEKRIGASTPTVQEPTQEDGTGEGDGDEADTNVAAIHVADKSDAIEYLKEHFPSQGYTATNLRTKAAFEAACVSCGVEFDFS